MADNDDLVVKIKADIRALQAGLRQAAKEADIAGKSMQKSIEGPMARMEKGLQAGAQAAGTAMLGMGAAAVAAGVGLAALTMRALETADGLVKLSDKTGFGIESLQKYGYAARQAGVDTGELDTGLEFFTKTLGNAITGGKEAAGVFAALGVSLVNLDGTARSNEQIFEDVISALERIPDPVKRSAAAVDLFSKSGMNMAILASQGTDAFKKQTQAAVDLGLVLGSDLVRSGDAAGDAIDTLRAIIGTGLNKALLQSAPQIEAFIAELVKDPAAIQKRIDQLVEGAKIIAEVGGAAAKSAVFVADFLNRLGHGLAMVASGETGFPLGQQIEKADEDVTRLTNRISYLKGSIKDNNSLHLDSSGFEEKLKKAEQDLERLRKNRAFLADEQMRLIEGGGPKSAPATPPSADPAKAQIDYQALAAKEEKRRAAEAAQRSADQKKKELDALRKQMADRLQILQDSVSTEQELETRRYEQSLVELQRINDQKLISDEGRQKLAEQLESQHQKRLLEIQRAEGADIEARHSSDVNAAADQERALDEFGMANADPLERERILEDQLYAEKLARLASFQEAELEMLGGYNAVKQALELEHWAKLGQIQADSLNSQFSFMEFAKTREQAYAASIADKALGMFAGQSKKLFELNKAASLAKAAVALPSAIMQSYENAGGYPLGIPAAAAMAAVGAAQIRAIASARYGGGSSPPVTGAAAAGGGVVGDTNAPQSAGTNATIVLQGSLFSAQQVRELIDQLNEASKDGARLTVSAR